MVLKARHITRTGAGFPDDALVGLHLDLGGARDRAIHHDHGRTLGSHRRSERRKVRDGRRGAPCATGCTVKGVIVSEAILLRPC